VRRDAYIENDSGGFSVVSGSAVDRIIEDQRQNDEQFVRAHEALLLLLVGDDSLPVRIVVDEPLREDEKREWLARIRWRLNVLDGRVLVMGGFDPDVLGWWRDEHAPDEDGRGVAVAQVAPGTWDLDVYTYVGSMNGNTLLEQGPAPVGTWFRRDHPDRAFPLWLAHILDYGGAEDPGYEDQWRHSKESVADGTLVIDANTRGFVGLLFHFHKRPADEELDPYPDAGWFDSEAGARMPERCPLGIATTVEDPNLVSLAQKLWGTEPRQQESPSPFIKGDHVDIAATWAEAPKALSEGPVLLPLERFAHAWAAVALVTEGTPYAEVRVSNAQGWQPPESEWLHIDRTDNEVVISSPENFAGWGAWSHMSALSRALSGVPDGASIDLMTSHSEIDEDQPNDGRLRLAGRVSGGQWAIERATPELPAAEWRAAFEFIGDLFERQRINTPLPGQRVALTNSYEEWADFLGEDCITRDESGANVKDSDARTLVLIAQPVYRARFFKYWMSGLLDAD
jgi:hypothetical protein